MYGLYVYIYIKLQSAHKTMQSMQLSDQTKTFLICKKSFIYFIQDNRLAAYKQN